MFAWINSNDIYQSPPEVHSLNISADTNFLRPEVATSTDPYFVIQQKSYDIGKRALAIDSWKDIVSQANRENGTLASFFGYGEDDGEKDNLMTLEATVDIAYFEDVHVKSDAWMDMLAAEQKAGAKTTTTLAKMAGGFLYK